MRNLYNPGNKKHHQIVLFLVCFLLPAYIYAQTEVMAWENMLSTWSITVQNVNH